MKKLKLFITIILLLLLTTTCEKPDYSAQIEPLLDQYVGVWNGDSLSDLDEIVTKDFQLRMIPAFDPMTGLEKLKEAITATRSQFPDFMINETEKLFVGDSAVIIRWTATGTFKGEGDLTITGKKVNVPSFSVIFFNDGKLTGEWIAYSDLTWSEQLGFSLVPPGIENKPK
jgi:predicted ester cyclase